MRDFIQYHFWPGLLKASWQAGVLIVLVFAVNWALGWRLSPRWRYGLWLLVVLRLALPWTIPSAVSLFNLVNISKVPGHAGFKSAVPADTASGPEIYSSMPASLDFSWVPFVWAVGVCGLGLWLAVSHWRLTRRVSANRPLIDGAVMNLLEDCKELMGVRVPVTLVETDAVDGPCLFGFLRPRLLLPLGFTRNFSLEELRHVFLHELGHVKRMDISLGWVMAVLQIAHWFNPLVWLAFSRMREERELACDAVALSYVGDTQPYGHTIVKLLSSFGDSLRAPSMAGIVEDKHQMKERITMIARFQKTSGAPVLAGAVAVVLGVLTLTDCKTATGETSADSAAGAGGAPKIVATSPKIGAKNVSPGVKEITVTFDQDMGRGMSWTGGPPNFPKTPEGVRAKWKNSRTCVLPVELEAGRYYWVGINSTSYQNFRSAAGMAAHPAAIYFTTRGAGGDLEAKTQAPSVVACDPPNGAQDVSASVTELRVTFDVPMGGGMSWCGGGDDFPKGPEGARAHWTEDRKTCVLPVELKPGMTYKIGLDAPSYKNFQSDGGVPLVPVGYTFSTRN
ncbi:MAG TPA: M56 family metallopeptidase [Verrucomicrobiae bacterium]